MSADSKAVFLSYASQDAEAAKKICEALRAAGIEVWFDQSELRGGDAWDQKIRKQIKECALFVPVISASTNARTEGYFRLEWKLAVDRSHLIAEDAPFIFPVVIDDIAEPAARVPDKFRDVQWTRLSVRDTPESLAVRIQRLLGRTEDTEVGAGSKEQGAGQRSAPRKRFSPAWLAVLIPIGVTLLALGAVAVKKFRDGDSKPAGGAPRSEADHLVARGYELLNNFHYRRDDLAVAEDFLRRATETAPGSSRAWAARAYVNALYLLRGWDREERRRQDTQTFANRALALDPNDTEAMLALAYLFNSQGAFVQTEALMRRAVELRFDDPRLPRALGAALRGQQRFDESVATLQDTVRRFPRDPLVRYELGLSHNFRLDPDAAFAEFEAALAIEPFASALLQKALYLANNKGDLSAARATLDQIATIDRSEDRAVGASMWVGLLERNAERVLAAAALTARTYLEDPGSQVAHGPKAITLALVHQVTGKEAVAQRYWQEAETLLRQRLREQPNDLDAQARLAICLTRLGQQDEAGVIAARLEALLGEQRGGPIVLMAYYHAGRGDAAKALAHVRNPLNRRLIFNDVPLALNPWFDPLRGQPEFERAVAEAKNRRSGGAEAAKPRETGDNGQSTLLRSDGATAGQAVKAESVAVLAFRPLGADLENEFLSEAISDELCSVLGRVPGLKVAATASSFSFKGKRVPPAEIGAQLGVAYLVDGTVQKVGNRVRVRAQLIKAADGTAVWTSETLDREVKDMFAVQDEVVGSVAKNLQVQLGVKPAVVTINPEAYRLYYEGRRAWSQRADPVHAAKAEELFQQAIRLDPKLGRAYAGLADARRNNLITRPRQLRFGDRNGAEGAELLRIAEMALQLEPESAEAFTARGTAYWVLWRFAEAERDLRTAIRLNPSYAEAHLNLGRVVQSDGRLDEALAEIKLATELDPLTSRIFDNYAGGLREAGRFDESLAQADRALALQPNSNQALRFRMYALSGLGRHEEAAAIARLPALGIDGGSAVALAAAGLNEEAGRVYTAASQAASAATPPGGSFAYALAAMGRYEEALNLLVPNQAVVTGVTYVLFYPAWDPVRIDPRFVRYLTALGIKEAHDRAQAWRAANQRAEDGGRRADKKGIAK